MRILASALDLGEHSHEVPVMVVPCVAPRVASVVMPPDGTTEREMADFVSVSLYGSVPYDDVQQIGLVCLAHSKGTDYRPAPREPLAAHAHWETW